MKSIYCTIMALVTGVAAATTVLPCGNARVWQTVFAPSDPLVWRWAEDSVSADVTVTNLLTGAVSNIGPVARLDASAYGSCAMPNPARSDETGEGLVDVSIRQYDSSQAVVYSRVARLAFLPGVNGGSFTVERNSAKFGKYLSPRVVPYDAAWADAPSATAAAAVFAPDGGVGVMSPLETVSGFFAQKKGKGSLSVEFDDGAAALTAQLYVPRGAIITFW